jgi:hypothetical protein
MDNPLGNIHGSDIASKAQEGAKVFNNEMGNFVNKVGIDKFMILVGMVMFLLSVFISWFSESVVINRNLLTNSVNLFSGATYFFGFLTFLCFVGIVAIFLMDYMGKTFNKIPLINTNMVSTMNLLSILLFVLTLGLMSTNMALAPAMTIDQVQTGMSVGLGFYLGFFGSLMILVFNVKKTLGF